MPTKYRLVTRSDFDGLVCAVLLKELKLIDEILFVHPKEMQDRKVEITARDITTNLPYVPGCYLAFDHHTSEAIVHRASHPENHVLDATADSAARVVYEYYGGKARFPGISDYITDTLETARARGYTETLFGRKTWFPRIKAANQNERAGSERAAINAPIQGTSADLIKRAMARMPQALADAGLSDVKMLLQVHDELVFEAPADKAAAAGEIIRGVMANAAEPALKLSVPLEIEIGTGQSWGDAH